MTVDFVARKCQPAPNDDHMLKWLTCGAQIIWRRTCVISEALYEPYCSDRDVSIGETSRYG